MCYIHKNANVCASGRYNLLQNEGKFIHPLQFLQTHYLPLVMAHFDFILHYKGEWEYYISHTIHGTTRIVVFYFSLILCSSAVLKPCSHERHCICVSMQLQTVTE